VHSIYLLKFFDRNNYLGFTLKMKIRETTSKGLHFDKCCQRHNPVQRLEDYNHHLSILDNTNIGRILSFSSLITQKVLNENKLNYSVLKSTRDKLQEYAIKN